MQIFQKLFKIWIFFCSDTFPRSLTYYKCLMYVQIFTIQIYRFSFKSIYPILASNYFLSVLYVSVFLVINCATALFWHPRNICEQSPAPSCEAGEYLQSQFIASTNESEIMNCSPYSTFERKLWFDCVVSSFILEFKNFSD